MEDTHMSDTTPIANPRSTNTTTTTATGNVPANLFAMPEKPSHITNAAIAPLTLQDRNVALPQSWFFAIYEDAPGEDAAEHFANTSDSDSSTAMITGSSKGKYDDENKENLRPSDYQMLKKSGGVKWADRVMSGNEREGNGANRKVFASVGNLEDDEMVF